MFCPRCGQQQISDEMKFCSRCGLPIHGVIEWLTQVDVPARVGEDPQLTFSPRRNGMRRAGKLMFLGGVLFPVFLAISLAVDDAGPMIVPVVILFVSLVWMLYARFFGAATAVFKTPPAQTSMGSASDAGALPPASNNRIPRVGEQQVRTKELAHPSVTEHTTKLLDQE